MKKFLLLFALVSFVFYGGFAENYLLLTNPKTGETNILRKGSYLVFELKADKSIREGFIKEIRDSSLSFEDIFFEGQVSLSEIKVLAGSSRARINACKAANIAGNVLLLAGLSVLDCGLDFMVYSDYYFWPIGAGIWITGTWIAGLGYAVDWASVPFEHRVRVRNYRGWMANIGSSPEKPSDMPPSPQPDMMKEQKENMPADSIPNAFPPKPSPDMYKPKKKEKKKKEKKITGDDVYGG